MYSILIAALLLTTASPPLPQRSAQNPSPTALPAAEIDSLLTFKARYLSPASQHLLRSWNASTAAAACESWRGIVCTESGRHIREIDLSGVGLAGSIAPHLGNISRLSSLDLSNNSFSGSIPSQLAGCTSLEVLDLHSNALTSPFPTLLAAIPSLRFLNLCDNRLGGPIPFAAFMNGNASGLYTLALCANSFTGSMPADLGLHLPGLGLLLLWNNNLTGNIPPSLANCSQLVHLQIFGNNLRGPIPAELGMLHKLQTLLLYSNILTGLIPASLGNCSNLQEFSIRSNNLSGYIPPQIGLLQMCRLFNAAENKLEGFIPPNLANCTSLTELSLAKNLLTGQIPPELGLLPKLENLLLWANNLTGHIPSSLGNCTALVELELQTNQLTGSIPNQLGSLLSLKNLLLNENYLMDRIPPSLGNCTNLTTLHLSFNELIGSIPATFQFNTRLQMLNLAKNQLSGGIPEGLGNCTELMVIGLTFNQLSGQIPAELCLQLSKLQILYVYGNNLSGGIPSGLGNCTNLRSVDLGSNQLSGTLPSELKNWAQLQMLSLPWNHLSGPLDVVDFSNFSQLYSAEFQFNELNGSLSNIAFPDLKSIQYLDLGSNRFTGEIPWESICLCTSLFNLSFAHNRLNGEISNSLGKLEKLQYLYLQGNLLQGKIPNLEGSSMAFLELDLSMNQLRGWLPSSIGHVMSTLAGSLDLSQNNFSGPLPQWVSQLTMALQIDLSKNRFVGSIPMELGDCVALIALDLSKNQLSGELPLQLGNLKNLETLNVAFNLLSGALPAFLWTKLPNLRHLNVSFNNFTGPILEDHEGVLRYVNASSFLGNPGLCGPILNRNCSRSPSMGSGHNLNGIRLTNWKGILLMALALTFILALGLILSFVTWRQRSSVSKTSDEITFQFPASKVAARRFTAQELLKATQGYSEDNLLGQGGSSIVYKGVLEDASVVAIKVLKEVCKGSFRGAFAKEVQTLGRLRHRNLVQVVGCVRNLDIQALVLEYMPNGSLESYLDLHEQLVLGKVEGNEPLSYLEAVSVVAVNIAEALTYLHHDCGNPIAHGDVKPGNILFDADMRPHLADFGLAKLLSKDVGSFSLSSNFKGSIGYMASEYAYAARITTKVDVYAYGVVILRMLTGLSPTHEILGVQSLHEWVKGKFSTDFGDDVDGVPLDAALVQAAKSSPYTILVEQLLRIGVACTATHPDDRPTMQQVLQILTSNNVQKIIKNKM